MLKRMQGFKLLRPTTVEEAYRLRDENPGSCFLAGGTDVFVHLKNGKASNDVLIDLSDIPGLTGLSRNEDGSYCLGAMTRIGYIQNDPEIRRLFPALSEAAGSLGSIQVRNLATVGGNVCNASPSGDMIPPLMAAGAMFRFYDGKAFCEVPAQSFFVGNGKTVLGKGILCQIILPSVEDGSYHYIKYSVRHNMDLAIVGVSFLVREMAGSVSFARIALGAVSKTVVFAEKASAYIVGKAIDETTASECGDIAKTECSPNPNSWRVSGDYRKDMVSVYVKRALIQAHQELESRNG